VIIFFLALLALDDQPVRGHVDSHVLWSEPGQFGPDNDRVVSFLQIQSRPAEGWPSQRPIRGSIVAVTLASIVVLATGAPAFERCVDLLAELLQCCPDFLR
jgi:hypothetical protein